MMKNKGATLAGLLAGGTVLGLSLLGNVDIRPLGVEMNRVDDFLLAMILGLSGYVVDARRAAMRARLDAEIRENRLAVLKATMRSVQDIMNNFLHGMQLIELEAEDALSAETREALESVKRQTLERLAALAAMETTPEVRRSTGMEIDYASGLPARKL